MFYQKAYDLTKINQENNSKKASFNLYELYKENNNFKKSLEWYEVFSTIKDTLNVRNNLKEIGEKQAELTYIKEQ